MSKKPKLDKRILMLWMLFLFIGTVFFVIGVSEHISIRNFKSNAVQAESVITDINRYRRSNRDSYSHEVQVAFTVNGMEYEGLINEWNSGMHIGQKITVFYNPDNPWDFRTGNSLLPLIFALIGLPVMLVGAIPLIMMIRKHVARRKLIESGTLVMADISEIIDSAYKFNNRYGRHIICERIDESTGIIYRYKSSIIWYDPFTIIEKQNIVKLPVYLDTINEKNYYVDTSALFEKIVDLT